MFHKFSAMLRRTNCPGCREEAIAWAAERMGLSYEKLMMQLTAEEQAGLKAAYESWKNREKKEVCWMMNENKMPHEAGKSNEPGKMPPPPHEAGKPHDGKMPPPPLHDGKGPHDGKMPLPHADQQAPNGQQPQGPQM